VKKWLIRLFRPCKEHVGREYAVIHVSGDGQYRLQYTCQRCGASAESRDIPWLNLTINEGS